MNADLLVTNLGGEWFAIETSAVAGIVEAERIPFLPGAKKFIEGIISLRNEPVTVIDLKKAFWEGPSQDGDGPKKIIIAKDKTRVIGLDIGGAEVTFIWNEGAGKPAEAGQEQGARFTKGIAVSEGRSIRLVDWAAIYDETSRILSTEGSSV